MRVTYENSIECQLDLLVDNAGKNVFLREDASHLGSYRQISRALKKLIDKKKIVKISQGVYAKAFSSKYIDEPLIENGFDVTAREALDRIGVQWEVGQAERDYNAGKTQQVPTQNIVRLKSRLRRKIAHGNRQLYFEGNTNAK